MNSTAIVTNIWRKKPSIEVCYWSYIVDININIEELIKGNIKDLGLVHFNAK